MMMADIQYNPDVCVLKHEIVDTKLMNLETRIDGIEDKIQQVYDLQKQILYAIIGTFGTTILILIGVIAGRAVDFGVFFG
jgi:hypothetical protein